MTLVGARRAAVQVVARAVARVVAWTVIVAVGAVLLAAVAVPRVAGATPYTILTGSMRPHLPPGTLAVVRPVDPTDVGIGTVLTYQLRSGEPEVVTHRVVEVGRGPDGRPRWRTRGDANDAVDPGWVQPVQVKGSLWYAVPVLGRVNLLLDGAQRRLLEGVAVTALLGYAAFRFAGAVRDGPRRPRPAGAR